MWLHWALMTTYFPFNWKMFHVSTRCWLIHSEEMGLILQRVSVWMLVCNSRLRCPEKNMLCWEGSLRCAKDWMCISDPVGFFFFFQSCCSVREHLDLGSGHKHIWISWLEFSSFCPWERQNHKIPYNWVFFLSLSNLDEKILAVWEMQARLEIFLGLSSMCCLHRTTCRSL